MAIERFGFIFRDPSPRAQAVVERDLHTMSTSYTRSYGLVVDRGDGARLYDVDDYEYIDFAAGIAVMATGYNHPRIQQAVRDQSVRFAHIGGTDFFYQEQVQLAERLQQVIPVNKAAPTQKRVYFGNSGAEAIEAAAKLARYKGGDNGKRNYIIGFYGAFHGRTMGALSLTASKAIQRADYPHLPGGVLHAPYPGKFACEHSAHPESIEFNPRKYIEKYIFKKVKPSEIAAIIVEPIQGEGGYLVPTDNFLPDLRALCDEYGILLIFDEIQAGMGRTGKWLGSENWGVEADIVCLAKGLGSGLPIGAIVTHENIMKRWVPGAHASTFGGNPIACRVAQATIDIIEDEGLLENVARLGEIAMHRLREMQTRFDVIKRVDGKGLMIGIEFANAAGEAISQFRNKVVDACFLNGLVTLACGTSTLRICPPLVITEEDICQGLDILEQAIEATLNDEAERGNADLNYHTLRALIIESDPAAQQTVQAQIEAIDMKAFCKVVATREAAVDALLNDELPYQLIVLDNTLGADDSEPGLELIHHEITEYSRVQHPLVLMYGRNLHPADLRDLIEGDIVATYVSKDEDNAAHVLRDKLRQHLVFEQV